MRNRRRRFAGLVAIAAIAVLVTACNPGAVTSIAGNGTAGNSGDGGKATDASFVQPGGLAILPDGSYDVVDQGACVIRHVSANGTISTIAGTGTCGYSGDGGPATAAQIKPAFPRVEAPSGQLAVDATGNVYLSDSGNGRIRRIATDGTITTIAGNGTAALFTGCIGGAVLSGSLAFAPDGTLYVDCPNGVFKLMPDGSLQTVIADTAVSMTVDTAGDIYYADNNGVVHKRTPDGTVTTFADLRSLGFVPPNAIAGQVGVTGLSVGPDGSVYAALGPTELEFTCGGEPCLEGLDNDEVLRLGPGTATVIAGSLGNPDPGTGTQSGYGPLLAVTPYGIAATAKNALLISSGHNVYSLQEANAAQAWSGTSCDPALVKPGYDLSGVDLSGQNFTRCNLTGVNLSNANLSGAILTKATLDDANLTGSDLSGATLDGAHGVRIIGTPAALPAGSYVTAGLLVPPSHDLSGLDLIGLDLTGADLAGVNLTNTMLTNTNLTGADLSGANLTGATLESATVANTNFAGATATSVVATTLTGIPANVPLDVQFRTDSTATHGAFLYPGANLAGANLDSVDLSGIDLTGANLTGTSLQSANLKHTNLTNANLSSADFAGATGKPVGADTSRYTLTICPDSAVVTSPETCIGDGF